jgi:hypothetical protein
MCLDRLLLSIRIRSNYPVILVLIGVRCEILLGNGKGQQRSHTTQTVETLPALVVGTEHANLAAFDVTHAIHQGDPSLSLGHVLCAEQTIGDDQDASAPTDGALFDGSFDFARAIRGFIGVLAEVSEKIIHQLGLPRILGV